jgi:uncharacterized membrane protein
MGSSCCCCLVVFLLVLAALGVTTLSIPQVWTFATGAWHSISNVFSATKQVAAEVKDLTRVKRSLGVDQDLADVIVHYLLYLLSLIVCIVILVCVIVFKRKLRKIEEKLSKLQQSQNFSQESVLVNIDNTSTAAASNLNSN